MLRPELQRIQYRNCRVDLYQRISRFPFKNTRTKQNETAQHSEQKKKKCRRAKSVCVVSGEMVRDIAPR